MSYPTIKLETLKGVKASKDVELFNLIKNWDSKVRPHLQTSEIIEALKDGFNDHFTNEETLNNYDWENPRLDYFGAIGFETLDMIMDEETFKEYIGDEYDEYFEHQWRDDFEDTEDDYKDYVKDGSYFAYRPLNRCHHIAPFLYVLGTKIYPEYEWFIFETPAHSNAIGTKDGEIRIVIDMLWGETHDTPQSLLSEMFVHSTRIIRVQLKDKYTEEQFVEIDKIFHKMKDSLLA